MEENDGADFAKVESLDREADPKSKAKEQYKKNHITDFERMSDYKTYAKVGQFED